MQKIMSFSYVFVHLLTFLYKRKKIQLINWWNHQRILNHTYGHKRRNKFGGQAYALKSRNIKIIFSNSLSSLWSTISEKICPSDVLALIYFRMQHWSHIYHWSLIYLKGKNFLFLTCFSLQNWSLNTFSNLM